MPGKRKEYDTKNPKLHSWCLNFDVRAKLSLTVPAPRASKCGSISYFSPSKEWQYLEKSVWTSFQSTVPPGIAGSDSSPCTWMPSTADGRRSSACSWRTAAAAWTGTRTRTRRWPPSRATRICKITVVRLGQRYDWKIIEEGFHNDYGL